MISCISPKRVDIHNYDEGYTASLNYLERDGLDLPEGIKDTLEHYVIFALEGR